MSAKGRGPAIASNPSPTVLTHNRSGRTQLLAPVDALGGPALGENKPPYRVPLMSELPEWNGLKVVSTFSGCGGSCTGYRMAGFKVIWANEFVPSARDSYRANAAPDCVLDRRDIRKVLAEDILIRTGLKEGELDLFDGSPPCQAFSTAGKREKGWGTEKHYEHGAHQKNEDLFFEYIRLLRGLIPRVFVAENVSGLIKGKAKGYFIEIIRELKASGYNVKCQVLDAQWLGVPQQRQRTIFIGVRNDIGLEPVFPKALSYRYSVRDACPWITDITNPAHGFTQENEFDVEQSAPTVPASGSAGYTGALVQSGARPVIWQDDDRPSPVIVAGRTTEIRSENLRRKFTIDEIKRLCSFPDDFILKGSYSQQWERLGNSVPPVMMYHVASTIRDHILLAE